MNPRDPAAGGPVIGLDTNILAVRYLAQDDARNNPPPPPGSPSDR